MEFFTKSTTEVVQVSFDLHPRHDQWLRLDQSLYKPAQASSNQLVPVSLRDDKYTCTQPTRTWPIVETWSWQSVF